MYYDSYSASITQPAFKLTWSTTYKQHTQGVEIDQSEQKKTLLLTPIKHCSAFKTKQ